MIKKLTIYSLVLANLCSSLAFAALVDPTRPADYEAKPGANVKTTLELNGIVISNDRKIAIINGQTVKVGDKIFDNQVMNIEDDDVELLGPTGNTITLNMNGQSVKQSR